LERKSMLPLVLLPLVRAIDGVIDADDLSREIATGPASGRRRHGADRGLTPGRQGPQIRKAVSAMARTDGVVDVINQLGELEGSRRSGTDE
jgi:hypothetical protein